MIIASYKEESKPATEILTVLNSDRVKEYSEKEIRHQIPLMSLVDELLRRRQ